MNSCFMCVNSVNEGVAERLVYGQQPDGGAMGRQLLDQC